MIIRRNTFSISPLFFCLFLEQVLVTTIAPLQLKYLSLFPIICERMKILNSFKKEINYMYNQYYNPYGAGQPGSNFGLVPPQKQQVVRVNGKNGADAYQLAPDSSVLLLDTSAPLIWLVQTDGAGYKTSTPYTIAPYKVQPVPETKVTELETRINRIEEELKEYHDKSNNANTVKYTVTKPSK